MSCEASCVCICLTSLHWQVSILEDQPLADVFSSLALQWKLKEETFKAKLSSITDSGVRTALNHRVKMVNKVRVVCK